MDLTGLPTFTVALVRFTPGAREAMIIGRLSGLSGICSLGGTLYRPGGRSIIGTVESPIRPDEDVELVTADVDRLDDLSSGQAYPWIDYAWNAYHADLILYGEWSPRTFVASPAERFKVGNVLGWQRSGTELPAGAVSLGVTQGAWDHEHCLICNAHIGAGGDASAYSDVDDHWLCKDCYAKYVPLRDISFLIET